MKIAITGIGIVSALGIGAEANKRELQAGVSHLQQAHILPTSHHEWPMGEVPYTNAQLAELAGQSPDAALSRNVLLGLIALREALADSSLSEEDLGSIPLVNGTTVGGMDITEQHYAEWRHGQWDTIEQLYQHEADMTSAMLAHCYGLQDSLTVSTACSSALNALIHGAGILRIGAAKRVVVGGTEALTRFHVNGFAALGILSQHTCRPFQEDRDGINLGEGAAYLMLEDADEAERRGVHIYGYIAGYANRCDAYHQTASSPDGDGAFDAMTHAIDMAGIAPSRIPYVNAHGTATPNNDASEWRAIERVFGNTMPCVKSTKPLTGHTTSASGSIEAVFTLFRMAQRHYPYAVCNAFGFGGNDSSIVLAQEPVALPELPSDPDVQITETVESDGTLDYKPYIPLMQARRMTPMLRQLIVVASEALREAGVRCPDAIIVGTQWGGMIPTVHLLEQLTTAGEHDFSPAQFMSSTHNAAAGTLARHFGAKGYNTTIAGAKPMANAQADAVLLLATGEAKTVLCCAFDEVDERWQSLLEHIHYPAKNVVQACVLYV